MAGELTPGAQAFVGVGDALSELAGKRKAEQKESALQADLPNIVEAARSGDYKGAMLMLAKHNPNILADPLAKSFGLAAEQEIAPKMEVVAGPSDYFAVDPRKATAKPLGIGAKPDPAKDREKRLDNQFDITTTQKYQDKYNAAVKDTEIKLAQLGNIDKFADAAIKNPIANAGLGIQVAKALGEVGAMTEKDVTRYVSNSALKAKVAAEVLALSKGTLLPENAKYLKESMQAIAEMAKDRQNYIKRKHAQQLANNYTANGQKMEYNEAAYRLGFTSDPSEDFFGEGTAKTPSATGSTTNPQPTTIIQNGYTYTLNPATGKYE